MTVGIAATTAMAVGNVAFVELVVVVTVTVDPAWPVRTGIDRRSNLMQCFECRPSQSVCEHCTENPIYLFPAKEVRGFSHNFHIHVSVSDWARPNRHRR